MPVFCGNVVSPRMSCGWELGIRRIGGRGQLESVVLARRRDLVRTPCATTIMTAHRVLEGRDSGFDMQVKEWKSDLVKEREKGEKGEKGEKSNLYTNVVVLVIL